MSNEDNNKSAIAEELEKLVSEHEVEEDLSDECMVLPESRATLNAAQDRLNRANQYQGLKTQFDALVVTVEYNEKHGGKAIENKIATYRDLLGDLEREMKHQIRAVKLIDKRYPRAKDKMLELIGKGA